MTIDNRCGSDRSSILLHVGVTIFFQLVSLHSQVYVWGTDVRNAGRGGEGAMQGVPRVD